MAEPIYECLSTRLLVLQCMFSVGEECPQLPSHLEMQLKVWLVHKHPSRLGMQLKDSVYKSCVHLRKFIFPSAVAALGVPLSQCKMVENVMIVSWETGMKTEAKRESQNAATIPRSPRHILMNMRGAADSEAKKASCHLEKQPYFPHLAHSSNSFKAHFALLLTQLTLCCTWLTIPKPCATSTNSNGHVSVQRLLKCVRGICTPT